LMSWKKEKKSKEIKKLNFVVVMMIEKGK
jgi:hypothetical protein